MSVEALTVIRFSWGYHTLEEIPLIRQIIEPDLQSFSSCARSKATRIVFFMEAMGGSETMISTIRGFRSPTTTLTDALIQESILRTEGQAPGGYDMTLARWCILNIQDDQAFGMGIAQAIDRLSAGRSTIEYDQEATLAPEANQINKDCYEALQKYTEAIRAAGANKEFSIVLSLYEDHIRKLARVQSLRNLRIAQRLSNYPQKATKTGRPVRVYARLGESHDDIPNKLVEITKDKKKYGEIQIEQTYDFKQPQRVFHEALGVKLITNSQAQIDSDTLTLALCSQFVERRLTDLGMTRLERVRRGNLVISRTKPEAARELLTLGADFSIEALDLFIRRRSPYSSNERNP